jgi:Family of unknown function (DUF6200)
MPETSGEKVEAGSTAKVNGHSTGVVIVDMGKQKRKDIKALKEGTGDLMDDVRATLDELRSNGTISSSAEPVVLVVREKPRKPKMWF